MQSAIYISSSATLIIIVIIIIIIIIKLWLSKGDLKAETESEIVAAQDQALQIKYYATKILNN